MESHIAKWGNSLGIRIPMALAKEIGLSEGTLIDLQVENESIIIRRKKNSLEMLLSRITPENLHGEIKTGHPVGREVW